MLSRLIRATVLAAIVGVLGAPTAAQADEQVLIDGKGVHPPVLKTTTTRRVLFVNRSGRIARVEFTGGPNASRVIEVPVQIWAYFDRPGRNPYVVRLGSGKGTVTLTGVIEVEKDEGKPELPTCDSETIPGGRIMGECIVW
jgi:hypothetical protein